MYVRLADAQFPNVDLQMSDKMQTKLLWQTTANVAEIWPRTDITWGPTVLTVSAQI